MACSSWLVRLAATTAVTTFACAQTANFVAPPGETVHPPGAGADADLLIVPPRRRPAYAAGMRFPNDTAFHMRMAALLIAAMFLEHLAATRLTHWSSPQIGVITFVLGLVWVALTGFHHARTTHDRIRVLEAKIERLTALTDALVEDQRARRSLPPL